MNEVISEFERVEALAERRLRSWTISFPQAWLAIAAALGFAACIYAIFSAAGTGTVLTLYAVSGISLAIFLAWRNLAWSRFLDEAYEQNPPNI